MTEVQLPQITQQKQNGEECKHYKTLLMEDLKADEMSERCRGIRLMLPPNLKR